jgi:hypothetical protein
MLLSKLKLDEENELEFSLQITGTSEQTKGVRFVIEGKDYSIMFPGTYENGNVHIKIPKMKGIMPAGIHECRMEVVVGDKIFSPLTESIEFEQLVEVDVKKTKIESIKEDVKVSPVRVTSKSAKLSKIDEAKQQGFDIAEYAGYKVLKKNDMYHGFVTETKMVMTKDAYNTITELVDALGAK